MTDDDAKMFDKAGKRRAPEPPAPPAAPDDDPVIEETVTYLPGPEDPPQTKFRGHHFHANLPKQLSGKKSWFDSIRLIRGYKVGVFDPATDAVAAQEEPERPRTSDEYKAHAVAWFKKMQSLHDFDDTWTHEETLRQQCGVGADDLDYLYSLARPKRADLEKKLRP